MMTDIFTVDSRGAAARLGIAAGTLRNMRVDGTSPPYVKVGYAVRYRVADLDAWLSARTVMPREAAASPNLTPLSGPRCGA
jgi:predicted DNA-binding transcriptional regulator AlpA